MSHWVVLPVLIPLIGATLGWVSWRSPRVQAVIGVAASGVHLAVSIALLTMVARHGILVAPIGSWTPPIGIVLTADLLGAIMVVLTALLGLTSNLTAVVEVDRQQKKVGFFPLMQVLLLGVSGAFLTGDLFNLFVFFEVMLMASFVLLALSGRRDALEGAVKYVGLNLFSSALFLIGAGMAYAMAGTLNMADLFAKLPAVAEQDPTAVTALGAFLLIAFAVKAGVFPLYFWLPASYHTSSPAVSAIFAGLLTKVGVYALVRLTTILAPASSALVEIMLWVAAATMVFGVLGAVAQTHTRRILGFHILSQIGYMVVGVGLLASDDPEVRQLGLAATVFYLAHHILVKTNLYLVGGAVLRMLGDERLKQAGGLARRAPWLAAVFLVPAFSLAGLPPLSGFWAKLAVLRSGALGEAWVVVTAAAVAGILTLVSMLKIWNEVFWKALPEGSTPAPALSASEKWMRGLPMAILAVATLTIGLWPAPLYELAERAAAQLLDPAATLEAVLPDGAVAASSEVSR